MWRRSCNGSGPYRFYFYGKRKREIICKLPNAIEGNTVEKCDTASSGFQSEETGLVDCIGTEEEILDQIRTLVTLLPANNEDNDSYDECTDDLNRVCSDLENAREDTSAALAIISDNNVFFETKQAYGTDIVTGFIKLNGMTVGAVANRSKVYDEDGNVVVDYNNKLTVRGCRKAKDFVDFCDAFSIPVLTLTNVSGFEATKCAEKSIARESAKLVYAFANATVPKVNVIIGKAYGSAYVTMNSKSIGADMVYAWPTAEIGMMDAGLAAKIMYADSDAETIKTEAEKYRELQASPMAAARRGYVDTIINPADTRKYVIGAFEMLFTKGKIVQQKNMERFSGVR